MTLLSDICIADIYCLIANLFTLLFQGFVSFLLPCFAVDHLYLSSDEYLFSEDSKPNSVTHSSSLIFTMKKTQCQIMKALLVSQRKVFGSMLTRYLCTHKNEYG